jgi:hypothetical protein
MNLNDPFGRLHRRDEAGYASLRSALATAGIDTADEAWRVLKRTRRKVMVFSAVVLACAVLLLLLLPTLAPITLALAFLLLVIGLNAALKSRRFIERYVTEEISR